MAKARKKSAGKAGTIKRGTCRVIKGRVRICASKTGKLTASPMAGKRRKTRKSATKKAGTKRTAKPKICKNKPTKTAKGFKGKCSCISKKSGNRVKVAKSACGKKRRKKAKK